MILLRTDPRTEAKRKNIHARVMAHVHDTSSEYALQMYEVSLKYLSQLSSYRAETI